ncbi:MAG: DUF559 domain-containing protein [Isosphaeraceae bacterium]
MAGERPPDRDELNARAKRLRREMTVPEQRLWYALRDRRLAGWKFRRQVVFGPYIVDFYSHSARLVLEIDGDSHIERGAQDRSRQAWLEARGLHVLRVSNDDLLRDEQDVIEGIAAVLARLGPASEQQHSRQ